jgi:amino-acid N-acetyltransferase
MSTSPGRLPAVLLREPGRGFAPLVATALAPDDLAALGAALDAAGLPADDLATANAACFFRFADTLGRTLGHGGLEGCGPDLLLRSLLVLPGERGHGVGAAIALGLERLAAKAGAERLHLLTIGAAGFFERQGYRAAERAVAPPAIAATAQFRTLCAASAVYLTRRVRDSW